MNNIDDWVWERSKYWWDLINRSYHTLYEMPVIEIDDTPRRRVGYCTKKGKDIRVIFYEPYIKTVGEKYDQTIAHELVHAHNFSFYNRNVGHSEEWKAGMRKIGLKPIVRSNYGVILGQHSYQCKCGQMLYFGKTQWKRLGTGERWYRCLNCNNIITKQ